MSGHHVVLGRPVRVSLRPAKAALALALALGCETSNVGTTGPARPVETRVIVTIESVGGGEGSVTSSPAGVNCPPTCSTFLVRPRGTDVILQATPAAGSVFLGWTGTCTGTDECRISSELATATVTARFARLPELEVTIATTGEATGSVSSSPPGIECPGDCKESFEAGTEVTLTATPGDGSVFTGWSGACTGTASCVLLMDAAKGVTATFAPIPSVQLTVTLDGNGDGVVASNPPGIDCPDECNAEFPAGTIVALAATPDLLSEFAGWSGACSGTDPCIVTMDEAKSVTATFEQIPHVDLEVTLASVDGGTGRVVSDPPGIDCPGECLDDFPVGSIVTLSATPGDGSIFAGWSGACSGTGACVVTMDESKSVTATFQQNPNVVLEVTVLSIGFAARGTVTSTPPGIDCPDDCEAEFGPGTVVTLVPTPDDGSFFVEWGGDCSGNGACVVTMDGARSVTATFAIIPIVELAVTLNSIDGGTGRVTSDPAGIDCPDDCVADFVVGTTVTLTATPLGESVFTGWDGACTGTGACVVTMDAAKSVQASFTSLPSGGGTIEVRIVDEVGSPVTPNAAAIQINGTWQPLSPQASYILDVPERFGFAVRCGNGARSFQATATEVGMLRILCANLGLANTNFGYSWSGINNLGSGSASILLNGPTGFISFGTGASGSQTVPSYPAFPQLDFIAGARLDGVMSGINILRGVSLSSGGSFNFNFGSSHIGGSATVDPFSVPEGILSAAWQTLFSTRRANIVVGSGTSSGGSFFTVPEFLLQMGDKYVVMAGGSGSGGHSVTFASVAALQAAVGVQLPPRWVNFEFPQPSLNPTFTNLGIADPDHVGFRFDFSYPSGPKADMTWHAFVSRGWLGQSTNYTFENPSNLAGFLDIAIASGDLVRIVTTRFSANKLVGELLNSRLIAGIPALNGLTMQTRSVSGTFTAP